MSTLHSLTASAISVLYSMDKHTFSGKERETKVKVDEHSQTTLGYQVVAFKCFHMPSHFHCVFTSTVNREGGRGVRMWDLCQFV